MYKKQDIGHVSMSVKVRRACWCVVSALLFRPFVTKVFRPWRLMVLRAFGAAIHSSAEVYASARIWAPWQLTMQEGSCIGPDVIVYNQAMVTLERDACVSQYAYICTAGHDVARPENGMPINNALTGLTVAPVRIGEEAWVGTRAFIGMGVCVGRRAVVGACACVFKDVEQETLVGGNPAQVIRRG